MRWLLALALLVCPGSLARAQSSLEQAAEEFRIVTRNLGIRADSPRKTSNGGAKRPAYHGRLFHNLRNNFLDAVPHEIVQRGGTQGILRRNQFGLNVTGPVWIPKLYNGGRSTFVTITYEGMREIIGRTYLRTIPTIEERTGDWSRVVDQAGQPLPIFDPLTTRANPAFDASRPLSTENLEWVRSQFPGNIIPPSRLDKVAARAAALLPEPNSDAGPFFRNNYFILAPELNRADGIIGRIDHTISDRHRLAGGWNYSNGLDGAAPWYPSAANPGPADRERRSRRLFVEHTFTKSARSVNTLTVEGQTDQFQDTVRKDENGRPFPHYVFQPYLSMGRSYPEANNARNYFIATNGISTRWREHRLRVVGQVIREQVNSYWPQYPEGDYRFGPGYTSLPGIVNTGHAFASFLLGAAEIAQLSVVGNRSYFRKSRYYWAFRDQWEIRKSFNLNLGFDLDISTPRTEKFDRQSTVSFALRNPDGGLPGALAVARRDGFGRSFQPVTRMPNVSAGLSWNVRGSTRNVLRMNFGRSYSPIPVYLGQWGTQGFNGNPTWIAPNVQLEPAVFLERGLPLNRTFPDLRPDALNYTIADLVEPTGRQPTYQSASLSFEKEVPWQIVFTVTAAYSGGRNLLLGNSSANPNAIPLSALAFRDELNNELFRRTLRPYPQYQRFDVYSAWPEGKYQRESLNLRLEKRTSGGLSLSASYEYSKQRDNYSGPYGVQDFYNRRNEWSLTSSNNPHRISLTYMYELPIGPNKMFLAATDWRRYLVDGWSLSGVTTYASGEPLALRPQFNNTGGVVEALTVNVVPGVNPRVPNPSPELWFNPAAFAHPPDFTTGNASRTHAFLRGPGNQNHDLSVTKRFPVAAERSVEFSMVGLNFINRANWADPDTVIGPPSAPNVNAGRIIESRGGRVIQLGLRFSF
jgi:hypothetical protein